MIYAERMRVETAKTENYTFCQQVCYMLTCGSFLGSLVTLTTLFLVISGLQYWITDYVVSVLGHEKETAFLVYIIVGALGPILGVAFSGCIFDRIGGYHGRNSPVVFTTFLIISSTMALLSPTTTSIYFLSLCLLIQLLFGGFTVPVITGYMLAQVPPNLRTLANSIANLFYNLLGFFPAPSIYGIVYQATGGGSSRYGLLSIQVFSAFTFFILLPIVCVQRFRMNRKIASFSANRLELAKMTESPDRHAKLEKSSQKLPGSDKEASSHEEQLEAELRPVDSRI